MRLFLTRNVKENESKLQKLSNLGGCRTIDEFVNKKLDILKNTERTFDALFPLMFSESENILYEQTVGFKTVKTTYGECRAEILRLAGVLKNILSFAPENAVVGIYMENSLEWIEIFWAVIMAGFRPLLMNLRLSDSVLENVLDDVSACGVISDKKVFSKKTFTVNEIKKETETKETGKAGTELLVMSSGTSDKVKICAYTAENIFYQIKDSGFIVKTSKEISRHYNGELKLLTFLPFYHIFGLFAVYFWFTFFSRTLVHLPDLAPETILKTVREHSVTHIFAVPLFWEKVYSSAIRQIHLRGEQTEKKFEKGAKIARKLDKIPFLKKAFSKAAFGEIRENIFGESISFLISGGSMLDNKVLDFFSVIGYHLVNGYGMSETGITSVELDKKFITSGSVGKPFPSIEYSVDENGILSVKGMSTATYVLCGKEKTFVCGEKFLTRDLAEEKDGHYYILGREDDVIISSSGENLNPALAEPLLCPKGANDVCLVPGKNGSAAVLLVSVSKYKTDLQGVLDEAKALLYKHNFSSLVGKTVLVSDGFIEADGFKKNRKHISKRYYENGFNIIDPENTDENAQRSAVEEKIAELFALSLGKESVGYREDFFLDAGGTSLEYFALLSELKKEFEIDFPLEESEELRTPEAFFEYIRDKI